MNTNAINGQYQTANVVSNPVDKSELNYESFLRIFVEALKNQDPMAPMQQSEMIGQLSQLTNMENNMKMVSIVEKMGQELMGSKMSQYADYIGKNVGVVTEDSDVVSGRVIAIFNDSGVLKATLDNNKDYEVERIKEIYE